MSVLHDVLDDGTIAVEARGPAHVYTLHEQNNRKTLPLFSHFGLWKINNWNWEIRPGEKYQARQRPRSWPLRHWIKSGNIEMDRFFLINLHIKRKCY